MNNEKMNNKVIFISQLEQKTEHVSSPLCTNVGFSSANFVAFLNSSLQRIVRMNSRKTILSTLFALSPDHRY